MVTIPRQNISKFWKVNASSQNYKPFKVGEMLSTLNWTIAKSLRVWDVHCSQTLNQSPTFYSLIFTLLLPKTLLIISRDLTRDIEGWVQVDFFACREWTQPISLHWQWWQVQWNHTFWIASRSGPKMMNSMVLTSGEVTGLSQDRVSKQDAVAGKHKKQVVVTSWYHSEWEGTVNTSERTNLVPQWVRRNCGTRAYNVGYLYILVKARRAFCQSTSWRGIPWSLDGGETLIRCSWYRRRYNCNQKGVAHE